MKKVRLRTILLVSLLLKLSVFCLMSPWTVKSEAEKILVSDSRGYQGLALNLLQHGSFAPVRDTVDAHRFSDSGCAGYLFLKSDSYRTPGYPLFLAAVYRLFGIRPYVAILCQILLSLFTLLLVYKISFLLFKEQGAARLAALLFALDIHTAYVSNLLLTDTLFTFFFVLFLYFFLRAFNPPAEGLGAGNNPEKLSRVVLSAVFLGLACLTRPIVYYYLFVPLGALLFLPQASRIFRIKTAFWAVVVFYLIACSWSYRNYEKYGHFQISTIQGHSLLMSNIVLLDSKISNLSRDSSAANFQRQADRMGFRDAPDVFVQSAIYEKVALGYIKLHKMAYLTMHALGGLNVFISLGNIGMSNNFGWAGEKPQTDFAQVSTDRLKQNFNFSNKRETILGILIFVLLLLQYLGALAGCFALLKSRNYFVLIFFVLTLIYFAGLTGVIGMYRYKVPLVPILCILGGLGAFKYRIFAIEKGT